MRDFLTSFFTILTTAWLCGGVNGAIIARESFDYSTGSVASANGGTGWNGAWRDITGSVAAITVGTGMTQGNFANVGGAMTIGATSTTRFRLLSSTAVSTIQQLQSSGGDLWLGFLGRNTGASGKGFQVTQMVGYNDTAANRRLIMGTNLFTGNSWSWSNETTIGNGNLSNIDTTSQVFYAIRFHFNSITSSTTTMYLFNTAVSDVTNLANASYVSAAGTNTDASRQPVFDRLRVSYQNINIDEIRLATTFGDLALTAAPTPTAPGITAHPANVAATEFGNASFSVTASGTAPLAYQWKKGGVDLAGQTASTLALTNLSLADAGNYSVTVTNTVGSATSNTASLTVTPYNRDVSAASGLLGRMLPLHATHFGTVFIPPENGMDVFEIESVGERIVLRGNTPVSIASAFNHYLKNICHCHVSRNGDQLALPAPLPLVPENIRVVSPHRVRFFYNPCTFGYTSAWWGWDKWQREIDQLAMDGVNVAQVTPGTEKVFLTTLRDHFGYTDAEVRAWLCMPSHLPWMLLSNMYGFGGPVPSALIDARATLGRQICDRMRVLGISPMVQGFYGMVPQDFKTRYPSADVRSQGSWAGGFQRPDMLNPTDPLFDTFTTHYAQALTAVFGPVKHLAADPFHEGGDTTGIDLAAAAGSVLVGISKVDPQATWVLEAWGSNPIQTMLDAVDKNRLLVLDLNCSNSETWRSRSAFGNTPWVWCAIQNFGGNTGMVAKLGTVASRPAAALADAARGPMAGIGAVPEGSHTIPAAYDLLFSHAWSSTAPSLVPWTRDYTRRRYGKSLPALDAAWDILLETALNLSGSFEEPHNSIICARPSVGTSIKARTWGTTDIPYDPAHLAAAWNSLSDAASQGGLSDAYRFDLADVARQVLCDLATRHQRMLAAAYSANDAAGVRTHGNRILEIIADLDTLCATRREWLLGAWLADARAWGTTPAEQDLCEHAARMLVTTWSASTSDLNDYANREWSGLLTGFYLPRWQQFLTALYAAMDQGTTFNETTIRNQIGAWELTWVNGHETYPATPAGDTVAIARSLWLKYGTEAAGDFDRTPYQVGASWTPAVCSTSQVRWTRDVTSLITQPGIWVATFQYTSGNNALQISRTALDDGSSTIAMDQHRGWTGIDTYDNRYYLPVTQLPAAVLFSATVNGAGGANSYGNLSVARCLETTLAANKWTVADCSATRVVWTRDVSATCLSPGSYRVTLQRTGGDSALTVDRAWLEQNSGIMAAEIRDETLTATGSQSWSFQVNSVAAGLPVLLRIATGSATAAGSSGTITFERTADPPTNPTSWEDWAASHGLNPALPGADADGDGVPNLLEFLQATNPGQPDTTQPLTMGPNTRLILRLAADRTGCAIQLESCTDLTDWQPDQSATFLGETYLPENQLLRSWQPASGQVRRFFRIHATTAVP